MPDLTLMEKIKKYASITNTINIPREEDKELFDRIMAKDSVFRCDALDLAELRQLANELKNAEIEAIVKYYTGIAYDMGIDVIDSEQYKSNNDNSIGTEVAENSKESSLDCSEREDSNSEQIERDKESKEIKRSNHITIELGESTIQRLSGILREKSCKNKEDAVQTITFDIIEDEEEYTIEDRNNVVIGISFEEVKGAAYKGLNILYRGVPGCGKTYAAKCDARALIGLKNRDDWADSEFEELHKRMVKAVTTDLDVPTLAVLSGFDALCSDQVYNLCGDFQTVSDLASIVESDGFVFISERLGLTASHLIPVAVRIYNQLAACLTDMLAFEEAFMS